LKRVKLGARKGRYYPANLREQVDEASMRLWRTPDAGCSRGAQSPERFSESVREGRLLTLNDQVAHLMPTPQHRDHRIGESSRWEDSRRSRNLNDYAAMFPTPKAADGAKGTRTPEGAAKEAARGHGADLPSHVQIFPTPTLYGNYNRRGSSPNSGDGLETFVKMYPTPTVNDSKNNNPPSQRTENGRHSDQLNVVAGGSLNPDWVEWLMGFPPGWTAIGGR
jgi:hypothetical protein